MQFNTVRTYKSEGQFFLRITSDKDKIWDMESYLQDQTYLAAYRIVNNNYLITEAIVLIAKVLITQITEKGYFPDASKSHMFYIIKSTLEKFQYFQIIYGANNITFSGFSPATATPTSAERDTPSPSQSPARAKSRRKARPQRQIIHQQQSCKNCSEKENHQNRRGSNETEGLRRFDPFSISTITK